MCTTTTSVARARARILACAYLTNSTSRLPASVFLNQNFGFKSVKQLRAASLVVKDCSVKELEGFKTTYKTVTTADAAVTQQPPFTTFLGNAHKLNTVLSATSVTDAWRRVTALSDHVLLAVHVVRPNGEARKSVGEVYNALVVYPGSIRPGRATVYYYAQLLWYLSKQSALRTRRLDVAFYETKVPEPSTKVSSLGKLKKYLVVALRAVTVVGVLLLALSVLRGRYARVGVCDAGLKDAVEHVTSGAHKSVCSKTTVPVVFNNPTKTSDVLRHIVDYLNKWFPCAEFTVVDKVSNAKSALYLYYPESGRELDTLAKEKFSACRSAVSSPDMCPLVFVNAFSDPSMLSWGLDVNDTSEVLTTFVKNGSVSLGSRGSVFNQAVSKVVQAQVP